MYCSEICRDADWSTVHKNMCEEKFIPISLSPFNFEKESDWYIDALQARMAMAVRLITCIGLDEIKKTALENKPMKSLLGDPKTKGFQDGKFQAATLEALLSLEDNFNKWSSEDLKSTSIVSKRLESTHIHIFVLNTLFASKKVPSRITLPLNSLTL
jgi:hypothetical protein